MSTAAYAASTITINGGGLPGMDNNHLDDGARYPTPARGEDASIPSLSFTYSTNAANTTNTAVAAATTAAAAAAPVAFAGGSSPKKMLPHIDDLTNFTLNIDMDQTISRILGEAAAHMADAENKKQFDRPAQAFKEFITVSEILLQVVPAHREFVSLKTDRKHKLGRIYMTLLDRLKNNQPDFEKIKSDIVADNQRTGVLPKSREPTTGARSTPSPNRRPFTTPSPEPPTYSNDSGLLQSGASPKPSVQPKPPFLHGKPLSSSTPSSEPTSESHDALLARFSKLGGPQLSAAVQDPRIKTRPPPIHYPAKPAGPRDMPPHNGVSLLPKVPEAIYSPARGTVTSEAAQLPSSTPRSLFSRTGSSASVATISGSGNNSSLSPREISAPAPPSSAASTHSPSHSLSTRPSRPTSSSAAFTIPDRDTVLPEELVQIMQRASVLLIDVRPRDQFDDGHVMSSATICVEPSVLMREHISADQIADSNVIAPPKEQQEFERRNKYDLVVMYDQSSTEIVKDRPTDEGTAALAAIETALVHFNYGKELVRPPRLLKGGLDAWIDTMGIHCLQTSASAAPQIRRPTIRTTGPRGRSSLVKSYVLRPLKPEEVDLWERTVQDEHQKIAQSPALVRSAEEFVRRFPPVSIERESMVATGGGGNGSGSGVSNSKPPGADFSYGSHKGGLDTDLPSPPKRPAPALPRPSFSGLSQRTQDGQPQATAPAQAARFSDGAGKVRGSGPGPSPHPTGLRNPGNWCYANSTLQALRAAFEFGNELAATEWQTIYRVPRKVNEKIDHPQLMTRIVANLFHWMNTGKFEVMKAQTLMDYSRHLCEKSALPEFGNHAQHDAGEFLGFLMDNLHDETNRRRTTEIPSEDNNSPNMQMSLVQQARDYWERYQNANRSIIDKYWRGLTCENMHCNNCGHSMRKFESWNMLFLNINRTGDTKKSSMSNISVLDLLLEWGKREPLDGYACDGCEVRGRVDKVSRLARLPTLLVVQLNRFEPDVQRGGFRKSLRKISWDFDDLDITPWFVTDDKAKNALPSSTTDTQDPGFLEPFIYECYAVVMHSGDDLDAGHYYTFVRDSSSKEKGAWLRYEDSQVSRVSKMTKDLRERIFASGKTVPYLIFFRRKLVSGPSHARSVY